MQYRFFGKTGLKVSELGFGCMRFPIIGNDKTRIDEKEALKMVHHAIDRGINYFDTAYPYHAQDFSKPGASEPFLAKALSNGYREKVYLATKLPCWLVGSREDMDRYLDEQLERLDTAYIDFYLLHALNRKSWDTMLQYGVIDFLEKALKDGKIRYVGFSFHDEIDLFKEIVDAYDWSFCQIMYNYFDEHFQAGREGLEYAHRKGLGVVAMEPLRGGALVTGLPAGAKEVLNIAAPGRSEVDWALGWLWNQPELAVVLSGMSTQEQLEENLELANNQSINPWTTEDKLAVEKATRVMKDLQKVPCTTCGYCLPCPEGVNIPRNFSLYNEHHMLNDPAAKARYHGLLTEVERASNCVQCGICLEKCPQQIQIPSQMEHVSALFDA
ncbi:MAG: aldo/keto reductase [Bacteroidetes bacterium]|nr:MAG: aldo/keto reductase [Bacteroidota bacterium]